MRRIRPNIQAWQTWILGLVAFVTFSVSAMPESPALGSAGTDVFRGFTTHISQQILQDKKDFYVAQTCTFFFYKKPKKHETPQVQNISYDVMFQSTENFDCPARYPKGLDEAREAFSRTQQALSLSLTFFEFALVGDKNDDEEYTSQELRDVMEAFGQTFEAHLPSAQYVSSLNRLFDTVKRQGEIETLANSMSILLNKGYRFTPADQAALNREIN